MKHNNFIISALLCTLTSFGAFGLSDEKPQEKYVPSDPVEQINAIGLQMFQKLVSSKIFPDGNVAISTPAIVSSLLLIRPAFEGETVAQMDKLFGKGPKLDVFETIAFRSDALPYGEAISNPASSSKYTLFLVILMPPASTDLSTFVSMSMDPSTAYTMNHAQKNLIN